MNNFIHSTLQLLAPRHMEETHWYMMFCGGERRRGSKVLDEVGVRERLSPRSSTWVERSGRHLTDLNGPFLDHCQRQAFSSEELPDKNLELFHRD
jgi:hypothetical protein